jgi:hypothetical protein
MKYKKYPNRYTFSEMREMQKTKDYRFYSDPIKEKVYLNTKFDIQNDEASDIFTTIMDANRKEYSCGWDDIFFVTEFDHYVYNTTVETLIIHLEKYIDWDFNLHKYIKFNFPNGYSEYILEEGYFWGVGLNLIIDVPVLTPLIIEDSICKFTDFMKNNGTFIKNGEYLESPKIILNDEKKNYIKEHWEKIY